MSPSLRVKQSLNSTFSVEIFFPISTKNTAFFPSPSRFLYLFISYPLSLHHCIISPWCQEGVFLIFATYVLLIAGESKRLNLHLEVARLHLRWLLKPQMLLNTFQLLCYTVKGQKVWNYTMSISQSIWIWRPKDLLKVPNSLSTMANSVQGVSNNKSQIPNYCSQMPGMINYHTRVLYFNTCWLYPQP